MNKYIYFFLILNFFFGSLVNGDEMVNKKNYQTVDPFNKDLSKVISKRGMYSNGDY